MNVIPDESTASISDSATDTSEQHGNQMATPESNGQGKIVRDFKVQVIMEDLNPTLPGTCAS